VSTSPVVKHAYHGDGVTTAFLTPFVFAASADLRVYTISVDDVVLLKEETTHYTVTGGGGAVGTVTLLTAPESGSVLLIVRVGPPDTLRYDFFGTTDDDSIVAQEAFDRYDKSALYLTVKTLQFSPPKAVIEGFAQEAAGGMFIPGDDQDFMHPPPTGDSAASTTATVVDTVLSRLTTMPPGFDGEDGFDTWPAMQTVSPPTSFRHSFLLMGA